MDDFGKFQLHQIKSCHNFWPLVLHFFQVVLGPFNNVFVVSFKLPFFQIKFALFG